LSRRQANGVSPTRSHSSARKDPLRVLDAAYAFELDEKAWLAGLCDAFHPYALGRGVAAYVSELGEKVSVRSVRSRDLTLPDGAVHVLARVLPAPFYRRIHAPLPATFSADCWPAAAADLGFRIPELMGAVSFVAPHGWAISGGDARHETVLVVFHCKVRDDLESRDRLVLDHLGAHLGSALRLRALLSRTPTGNDAAVEGVFAPDGKLLDLRGDALGKRETLVDAVRRVERAKLRNAAPEERLELWTALVEGRWSIIESTESDGKRTMLACRNTPRTAHLRALTDREKTVAEYVSLGHALKYIAYELGVAIATVAADLDSALKKLGLTSRAELIRLFAS
jgi:DNA-binding CsgD family transcriptional regulator